MSERARQRKGQRERVMEWRAKEIRDRAEMFSHLSGLTFVVGLICVGIAIYVVISEMTLPYGSIPGAISFSVWRSGCRSSHRSCTSAPTPKSRTASQRQSNRVLGFDLSSFDLLNRPPGTRGAPHSPTRLSAQPAHAVARPDTSATKWCCTAGLHPENRHPTSGNAFPSQLAFRVTTCNIKSVKRCAKLAFREFRQKCHYRICSRGQSVCLGCCRATVVLLS